ncbi:MAG: hypothetical protein LUM44_12245 [Pyrinomonadaceae bacterium]|nr:hypothetical protein [Pyrinomonadaceae bacterium]
MIKAIIDDVTVTFENGVWTSSNSKLLEYLNLATANEMLSPSQTYSPNLTKEELAAFCVIRFLDGEILEMPDNSDEYVENRVY